MNSLPRKRADAKKAGSKFYFTGKACVNSGIAKRRTSTGSCMCEKCAKSRNKACRDHYYSHRSYYEHKAKSYYAENSATIKARRVDRYKHTRERERILSKIDYENNREKRIAASRRWQNNNMDKVRATVNRRRAAKLRATPAWADSKAIEAVYSAASLLNCWHGPRAEVDHIVPLQSALVCGLHWEGNLQILWKKENLEKGNRYWPDMPEEK